MIHSIIILIAKYLFLVPAVMCVVMAAKMTVPERTSLLVRALVTAAVSVVLAKTAGALYDDPRPFVVLHMVPWIPHGPDNGMPSDHTLTAMGASLLMLPQRRVWAAIGVVCTAAVGFSRIVCLLHTPLDVAVSMLIGVVSAAAGFYVSSCLEERKLMRQKS